MASKLSLSSAIDVNPSFHSSILDGAYVYWRDQGLHSKKKFAKGLISEYGSFGQGPLLINLHRSQVLYNVRVHWFKYRLPWIDPTSDALRVIGVTLDNQTNSTNLLDIYSCDQNCKI